MRACLFGRSRLRSAHLILRGPCVGARGRPACARAGATSGAKSVKTLVRSATEEKRLRIPSCVEADKDERFCGCAVRAVKIAKKEQLTEKGALWSAQI